MRRSDRVLLRLTVQLVSPPSHSPICPQTHDDDADDAYADDHYFDDAEDHHYDDDVEQAKHLSPTKC